MKRSGELVSVIIPTYKNITELERAIDSVLAQTYKNLEIIIVDDNFPESEWRGKTYNLVNSYNDERMIYLPNEKNSERSFSRNNGAKHSHGEYIMFLDNDDEFLPQKIETQLKVLTNKGNEYAFCYSNYIRKYNGKIVCYGGECREGNLLFDTLARNVFIHPGSNLLIRREAFFEVGGFNENISLNEDMELMVKLFKKYKVAYCAECGLIVHLGPPSVSVFDFEKATKDYRELVGNEISMLQANEKKRLDKYHGLQLIRHYCLTEPRVALKYKKIMGVSNIEVIKYFCYLIKRYFNKKAYGFII